MNKEIKERRENLLKRQETERQPAWKEEKQISRGTGKRSRPWVDCNQLHNKE